MSFGMKTFILSGMIALGAGMALGGGIAVRTVRPEVLAAGEGYVCAGRAMASHEVNLSARVVGEIVERNGEEGERVRKGDVLFRLDDTAYKADLMAAEAELEELEVELRIAEVEAQRFSAGEQRGGVSKSDRDRVILSRDQAKAKVKGAKAKVMRCRKAFGDCTIRSPVDGVLGRLHYDVGNNVSPESGTLRSVVDDDPIDIVFAVSDLQLAWLRAMESRCREIRYELLRPDGVPVPIEIRAFAQDNKVDAATGTRALRFRGKNPNGELLHGAFVKVRLTEVFKEPRLAIPMTAVGFEGTNRFVYVVKDGKALRRPVAMGDMAGDCVFVDRGLSSADEVVPVGIHRLYDGAEVNVKTEGRK